MLFVKKIKKLIMLSLFFVHIEAYPIQDNEAKMIEQSIGQLMRENHIPGGAVQTYGNERVRSYYFGVENILTQKEVTANTVFEVGSFTKLFTCLLLAEEVIAGRMKLTDSVTKYLPQYSESFFNSITLESLATHTSSLPFLPPYNIQKQSQVYDYLAQWCPLEKVGTVWQYSNVGYGLLGNVIEAETHTDMNTLYIERILKPLGMQSIGINVPKKFQSDYAQGYERHGYPVPHAHYAQSYNDEGKAISHFKLSLLPAAGAMKMTSHDTLLFLKLAVGDSDVPNELAQAMQMTQKTYVHTSQLEQGLGWGIYPLTFPIDKTLQKKLLAAKERFDREALPAEILSPAQQNFNGNALMEKTGLTGGFRAYIGVISNKKLGVIILLNRCISTHELVKTGRKILLNLLGSEK